VDRVGERESRSASTVACDELYSHELSLSIECATGKTLIESRVHYGVATMSRRLKIIGLFCRISFLL